MLLRPINSHSLLATSCLENDRGTTEASSLSARQLEDSEEEEEEDRGRGAIERVQIPGRGWKEGGSPIKNLLKGPLGKSQ